MLDGRTARWLRRKPELLGLATEYVLANGVAGLTLRPLATALGVTIGTIIRQFGSKEELLQLIVQQISARLVTSLSEDPELAGRLATEIADSLWSRWLSEGERPEFLLFFEIYGLALRDRQQYGWFLSTAVDSWVQLIADTLGREGCDPALAVVKASSLLAVLRGLQMVLTATGDDRLVTEAFRWSVSLILDHDRDSR